MTQRRLHFVGGLLRSGSTLLCNILNQNPRFYVSSTSPLPGAVGSVSSVFSRSAEIKGLMVRDRELTLKRMTRSVRSLADAWYSHLEEPEVIFDKSRAWNYYAPLIHNVWPEAKIITIVRDLRSIVGSVEKQHFNTAILDEAGSLEQKTVFHRVQWLFTKESPLGSALLGLEDLIRRQPKNWHWLKYEDLCNYPGATLRKLYEAIGEPVFEHDLKNVVNVAEDVDEIYNLKFPHQGDGPLRPAEPHDWKEWVHASLEPEITKLSFYYDYFGYNR